jgi:hypothetical protein
MSQDFFCPFVPPKDALIGVYYINTILGIAEYVEIVLVVHGCIIPRSFMNNAGYAIRWRPAK